MSAAPMPVESAIFGSREHLDVSRALSELLARRPVRICTCDESLIALPLERREDHTLPDFTILCSPAVPQLIVTRQRARAIGIETSVPMALSIPHTVDARGIFELAADSKRHFTAGAEAASYAARAAIRLVKLARGLPAILTAHVTAVEGETVQSISVVGADAVNRFVADAMDTLAVASEASIPLASGASARFVVFRDALGIDQVAIIVGKPDHSEPVPVRLHSACLTGDVFGSRRCDCGDQLQL